MWYRLQRTILCLVAIVAMSFSSLPAQAGWGHWGHHHRGFYGGFYGGSLGWGYPGYSYSSFYYARPRLFHPFRVGYYSSYSYYAPSVSYSVSLPSYYYAPPTYYVAPTYYTTPSYYSAPVVYPSTNCCDPCATSVTYPSVSYPAASPGYSAPTYSEPNYSTGTEPQDYVTSPQFAATGGSFVDRMLSRSTVSATRPNYVAAAHSDSSVRTVSTLKPVTPSVRDSSTPVSIDELTPIPANLLKTADEMFALGGYEQAASAYARLAVRYGNHDELAVRRFIALVASGDHAQASIVYELAMVNGRPLTMNALPGGLVSLYGASASNRKNHIESLASYALKAENEALPLRMVGTWLELDGQAQRAATFFKRADTLDPSSASPAAPTVASRLADAQLAR